ncbi:MAG: hypothetical protein GY755_25215 [Chloroflexi bacterium]|nr:hypothetical protein [Chloroflexota bacterium]
MKGDTLPENDHIVRYAKPSLVDDGDIDGAAFQKRASEDAISINWIECFQGMTKEEQLGEVRRLFRLSVRPNGRFAELHVGDTIQHLIDELVDLGFKEDPLEADEADNQEADPSHALIVGTPDPVADPEFAEMIGDMIAACVIDSHPTT